MRQSAAGWWDSERRDVVESAIARGIKHGQRDLEWHADEHSLQDCPDAGYVRAFFFFAQDRLPVDAHIVEAAEL